MKKKKISLAISCIVTLFTLACKKSEVITLNNEKINMAIDSSANNLLIINALVEKDPAITKFLDDYSNSTALQKRFNRKKIVLSSSNNSR